MAKTVSVGSAGQQKASPTPGVVPAKVAPGAASGMPGYFLNNIFAGIRRGVQNGPAGIAQGIAQGIRRGVPYQMPQQQFPGAMPQQPRVGLPEQARVPGTGAPSAQGLGQLLQGRDLARTIAQPPPQARANIGRGKGGQTQQQPQNPYPMPALIPNGPPVPPPVAPTIGSALNPTLPPPPAPQRRLSYPEMLQQMAPGDYDERGNFIGGGA